MKPLTEQLSILVVEDNPSDCYLIEQMLASEPSLIGNIYTAERFSEAICQMEAHPINLVLLDLSLPDSFGIQSLLQLRKAAPKLPVIILTGLNDSDMALEAINQGAQDYLVKGEFNIGFLVKSIQYSVERKKAEEKVLISEEKYRQIFYKNPFPMWINDIDTFEILEVNDAAIKKYGYEREEFLNLTVNDIQRPGLPISQTPVLGPEQGKIWRHQKKNGEIMLVEFTYYPINYFGRTAMQAQINDVTEKVKLQSEVTLKKKQIMEAVLSAQETERRTIGVELHDNINQILTAIQLNLGFAIEHPSQRDELLPKCMHNTSQAIEEVRKLSKSLILPRDIKDLGLLPSLELLINDILPVTGIKFTLDAAGLDESLLTEEQKITLYRIIQEQLNNILKHSHSSAVSIHLCTEEDQVTLLIQDNGKGFDPGTRKKGIGIANIISRAELFNGKVKIHSSPGQGCQLEVMLRSKAQQAAELNDVYQ